MSWKLTILPQGVELKAPDGSSVWEAVGQLEEDLSGILLAPCAGQGQCGRCRIKVRAGERLPEPTPAEKELLGTDELLAGYRLACQLRPVSDVAVLVPKALISGLSQLQVEGLDRAVSLDPAVKRYQLALRPPEREGPITWREICPAVREAAELPGECSPDLELFRQTPLPLEPGPYLAGIHGDQIVSLKPARDWSPALGLAIDLGTTKVAGYLLDLESGRVLASTGKPNPQIAYGDDVISRLGHAWQTPREAEKLAGLAADCLSEIAGELATEAGFSAGDIVDMVVAGNTAMHHLALNLPVGQLVRAPYLAAVTGALDVKARHLGIRVSPSAWVHFPPNIASFVGGDAVAMSLAAGLDKCQGPVLGMDIGTNTELVLAHAGELYCASCPSGPAFEGGRISCGLRASAGAMDRCRLDQAGDLAAYETLDQGAPNGLCGSGLLDLAAELSARGVVDPLGRLDEDHPRVRKAEGGELEYLILEKERTASGRDLAISQQDLSELQLAKGAVYAGIALLLAEAGLAAADLREVLVAGAFGCHLDLERAMRIGMLPRLPLGVYRQVGNAAGSGARMMLLSLAERQRAGELARRTRHLELAAKPEFGQVFARALKWGEADGG